MKTLCNINRSGRLSGSNASGGGRIIPFSDTTLEPPDYSIIFTDSYGVIWGPSQLVQIIKKMGYQTSLILGYAVRERERVGDITYYELVAEFHIDQLSDVGFIDDKPAVTITRRFAPIDTWALAAGEYTTETVRFLDQIYFRQSKVVIIPGGTIPPAGSSQPWWTVTIPVSDPNSYEGGSMINQINAKLPEDFAALRSPFGVVKINNMTMCRFTPYFELNVLSGETVTLKSYVLANLHLPLAISADGNTIYFAGYYSEPRGMAEEMAPVLQYAILSQSQSGPVDHVAALANAALIVPGPYPAH